MTTIFLAVQARAPTPTGQRYRQTGVGMIEVLVAVLLLAVGFLGMAALQASSLSTNNSAMARSMATIASYSILDAMRADVVNARAGKYNSNGAGIKASACPTATDTFANTQLGLWCTQLGEKLGAIDTTTGLINCTNTGNCVVTITFDDSRAGAGGSDAQAVTARAIL